MAKTHPIAVAAFRRLQADLADQIIRIAQAHTVPIEDVAAACAHLERAADLVAQAEHVLSRRGAA